jgi:hypothetical protein
MPTLRNDMPPSCGRVLRGREPFTTGGFRLRCRRPVAKGSRPLPVLGAAIRFLLGKVGASTYPTGLALRIWT